MPSLPKPVDDPVMQKLVTLVQEQMPYSGRRARVHLLEQLFALEREALEVEADPKTLCSIRAAQNFVRRSGTLSGS